MNLGLMYYLLTVVTSFGDFFCWISLAGLIGWGSGILMYGASYLETYDDELKPLKYERLKWHTKRWLTCLFIATVLNAALPSKKDMLIIAGLTLTNETIKNTAAELKDTVPSLVKLINDEIRKLSEDVAPEQDNPNVKKDSP